MAGTNKTVGPPAERENNYIPSIPKLSPEAHELLTKYSHIPEDEIIPHVHAIRDQAWRICPYGCIGLFGFTAPAIQNHPHYQDLLSRTRNGDKMLDLGCGFGQNMRKLVLDGAPRKAVFGADVSEELIKCGIEYFRDGDMPFVCFIGDLLAKIEDGPNPLDMAKGQFDIVYASMFYHLWNRDTQLHASIATISLLKPQPGSVVFGWQIGASPAVEVQRNLEESRRAHTTMFRHDEQSFRKLWEDAGKETDTQWKVEVEFTVPGWMKGVKGKGMDGCDSESDVGVIIFSVTRL